MCCTIPLDIDRWTGSGLAMKFFSLTTYNPFPPLVSKRLNLVLLSLIEKLSQPELIHSILLAQLRPSAPIVPAAEQNPIPEIPSLQQEEPSSTPCRHHPILHRPAVQLLPHASPLSAPPPDLPRRTHPPHHPPKMFSSL
ncbi:hypothetical protein PCANC_25427 [Puccinia coronata f. sp. avenae]|uniref:Uncharacterized protein n=1 Tax=Puccinia coronata f. sp. avenae TaxID=200324 RepID=A0A2N5TM48_9BASI|nr:hypothetical protein PCANC_25427 [Puccinia coronata f. sp. avenae]